MTPVEPCRSPAAGSGCPLWEIRASIVTRPAFERFRPGSMDLESSRSNFTGQLPTVVRNTATGIPGEATDFATMNSVAPAAALAFSAAASDTSPLTAATNPGEDVLGAVDVKLPLSSGGKGGS